jgi:hypothetical protein
VRTYKREKERSTAPKETCMELANTFFAKENSLRKVSVKYSVNL